MTDPRLEELKKRVPEGLSRELIRIYPPGDWKDSGAFFFESLGEWFEEWMGINYTWIGESQYGDDVVVTRRDPERKLGGIYLVGLDVAGDPHGESRPGNLLCLAEDVKSWIERIEQFGDEFAIGPGGIEREVAEPKAYRQIYRDLNPFIDW